MNQFTEHLPMDYPLRAANTPIIDVLVRTRSAANCAAFLLPHLRPGMRLLDCGCGPGSITIGLAQAVAPGAVIGIDIDEASLAVARQAAEEQKLSNLRLEKADVRELPFPDASFDVVFSHAVLLYQQDPVAVLREMKRVLVPGGLVAIRNDDTDGMLLSSSDPVVFEAQRLWDALVHQAGGNRYGPKHSRSWLHAAGFTNIIASASYETFGTPEATAALGQFTYVALDNLTDRLVELGVAKGEEVERIRQAWLKWGESPDAFSAKAWCEALGWKP